MKKWERNVRSAITDGGAKVLERTSSDGHLKFSILLPSGSVRKLTCANSPKIKEHALRAVTAEVRAMIFSDQPPERQP
jgi:hypothetical protein